MLIAIIFEEQGAYQFRKNKEMERQNRAAGGGGGETADKPVGLEPGFEEDFSFGGEDDNNYWDKTILDENGNVERAASTYR